MLGDARTDAVNAQAGANTALFLLQVEQYLIEEPLFTREEAIEGRALLEKKLDAEESWQRGHAWGAGTYQVLRDTREYLRDSYLPQDKSPIQSAVETADIKNNILNLSNQLEIFNNQLVSLSDERKKLVSRQEYYHTTKVWYDGSEYTVESSVYFGENPESAGGAEYFSGMRAISIELDIVNRKIDDFVKSINSINIQKNQLEYQLSLYPGATIVVVPGGYGIARPSFNHPGGNADFINGAAGANTAAILLQLSQYFSMESLLPLEMQEIHREQIKKDITAEIQWQSAYAWGASAYQSLQGALSEIENRPYSVFDSTGLDGTDFGGFDNAGIPDGEFFALSDIIPLTKQDFSKILDAMSVSDWYVSGVTRLFSHDEYVEMIASAWSNPYYARQWLQATRTESDIIGFRPSTCADILLRAKSGKKSAINYADAAKSCLTPKKKKGLFGGMGGIIGIILAIAIVAITWQLELLPLLSSFIAGTVGVSVSLATTIAAAATIAAASSTVIQVVTTGEINPLNVAIAAVAAAAMVGISSAMSDVFSPPSDITVSPDIVEIPADLSSTTFELVPDTVPWYQQTIDLPIIGETNIAEAATKQVISSSINAGQQGAKTGTVDPASIATGAAISIVNPFLVKGGVDMWDEFGNYIGGDDGNYYNYGDDGMVFEDAAQTVDYSLSEDYSNVIGTDLSFGQDVIEATSVDSDSSLLSYMFGWGADIPNSDISNIGASSNIDDNSSLNDTLSEDTINAMNIFSQEQRGYLTIQAQQSANSNGTSFPEELDKLIANNQEVLGRAVVADNSISPTDSGILNSILRSSAVSVATKVTDNAISNAIKNFFSPSNTVNKITGQKLLAPAGYVYNSKGQLINSKGQIVDSQLNPIQSYTPILIGAGVIGAIVFGPKLIKSFSK